MGASADGFETVRLEDAADLVRLAAQADHQHRREVRVPGVPGKGPPQDGEPLA